MDDVTEIAVLIPRSARALQSGDYPPEMINAALGTVFGVDTQLIVDGTYLVAEIGSQLVGCGGWSRRKTLFGSDHIAGKDDGWLDPLVDAARVRAFFVDPKWARHGIGSRILEECESAARAHGFRRLELVATLTGEPLYAARGFVVVERFEVPLANGMQMRVARMAKSLSTDRWPAGAS
jgi:GNAT superfamily N-acetyltransferase